MMTWGGGGGGTWGEGGGGQAVTTTPYKSHGIHTVSSWSPGVALIQQVGVDVSTGYNISGHKVTCSCYIIAVDCRVISSVLIDITFTVECHSPCPTEIHVTCPTLYHMLSSPHVRLNSH